MSCWSVSKMRIAGFGVLGGVTAFVGIVVSLHLVQPEYDFRRQLMSELADGAAGWAMLPAFLSLAGAVASLRTGVARLAAHASVTGALAVSSLGFVGAGVWTLQAAAVPHVASIVAAFVGLVLSMCLFPKYGGVLGKQVPPLLSWTLAGVAAAVVAGVDVLSLGIAQRIAATSVLLWLMAVGLHLTLRNEQTS